LAALFLRLGVTSFGGPAAHNALFHDETVKRRRWLDDQHFLDLLGATNLIPGPNSTEMAIHIGFLRAGWTGLVVAGICFILPAMVIVTAMAWAYVQFGSTPQVAWLLYGVKPVVIAVIVQALWGLGKKAVKGPVTAGLAIGVVILYFLGINELALLLIAGLAALLAGHPNREALALSKIRVGKRGLAAFALGAMFILFAVAVPSLVLDGNVTPNPNSLFLVFLRIGSVIFGSGYVLLAFLRADFVTRLGWLTEGQLVDAVAVGQVTPGPVFTTATFIGYVLGGVPGAVLSTIGIFLPAFVLVAVTTPYIRQMRKSVLAGSLLDGVNAASLGLMAAVTWQLGRASIVDPLTVAVALGSAVALFRFKVNSTLLIVIGAAIGLVSGALF
jgi:chromate transporter